MQCGVVMVLYPYPHANDIHSKNATIVDPVIYFIIDNLFDFIGCAPNFMDQASLSFLIYIKIGIFNIREKHGQFDP